MQVLTAVEYCSVMGSRKSRHSQWPFLYWPLMEPSVRLQCSSKVLPFDCFECNFPSRLCA